MTFGRMEPGSPEWGRALDAHLQPPEYDGCEDCDCEEAEYPEPVECRDHDDCQHPCTCKCHDIPQEPDAHDLWVDEQMEREAHGPDREDY